MRRHVAGAPRVTRQRPEASSLVMHDVWAVTTSSTCTTPARQRMRLDTSASRRRSSAEARGDMLCTHGIDIPLPIPLTCCGRSLTEVRGALESVRALHDVAESRHGAIDRPVANRPNAKVARNDDAEVKPVLRGDVHGRLLLFSLGLHVGVVRSPGGLL